MSVGCKIIKDFRRPVTELVERFRDMPVANIDDNMNRIAAVDAAIEPIGYKGQLLGTAFTVRVAQGDNLLFHAAMALAKATEAVEEKEARIMEHILGDGTYIRPWVDEKLREIGCEIVD